MRKITLCFSLAFAVLALVNVSRAGNAEVLYSFTGGNDGANPVADLVEVDGNLWGTAKNGAKGFGAVFELTPNSGPYKLGFAYDFQGGNDGATPEAGLVLEGGNFYGTTSAGGSSNLGTVFVLCAPGSTSPPPCTGFANWMEFVLHPFTGQTGDGATPKAELLVDPNTGNLYGTTSAGGSNNLGTVFVMCAPGSASPPVCQGFATWTEVVLYSFAGQPDGANPVAGLEFDSEFNLWGTAENGGANGVGTVFELAAPGYTQLAYVHSFLGEPYGAYPAAALTFDHNAGGALGTLYGTTSAGGNDTCKGGCGTAFQLEISGLVFSNFYSFTGASGTKSGAAPIGRLQVETSQNGHQGHLYGTASLGGNTSGRCTTEGCGTVFEICPPTICKKPAEYTLLRFNGKDGENPAAGLLLDVPLQGLEAELEGARPLTGKGACTGNCIGTAENGGAKGVGGVIGLGP